MTDLLMAIAAVVVAVLAVVVGVVYLRRPER